MQLILLATKREATGVIKALNAKEVEENCYQFPGGEIVISGIGFLHALFAITRRPYPISSILNLGIAASLDPAISLQSEHRISEVSHQAVFLTDHLDSSTKRLTEEVWPPLRLGGSGMSLVTVDHPVHDKATAKRLGIRAKLLDMEGYGVAAAATKLGIPCELIKIVSDYAEDPSRSLLREQLPKAVDKMAEIAATVAGGTNSLPLSTPH